MTSVAHTVAAIAAARHATAFKRLAAGCSDAEKAALFAGSAASTYRLGELPAGLVPDLSRRPAGASQRAP